MSILTLEERDRRWKAVREVMESRGLDCLIIWSNWGNNRRLDANLRYLANLTFEGYLTLPLKGEPTAFTFLKTGGVSGWVNDERTGHPSFSRAISAKLSELHLEKGNIGLVGDSTGYYYEWGFSYPTYLALKKQFPGATFKDATDLLEKVRLVKSDAEIKCFEVACEVGDRVNQTFMECAGAGVTDYEVAANVMDTLFRESCEPSSMLLYASGKQVIHAGPMGYIKPPGAPPLEQGDMILTEFDARYQGYVAQYNQAFSLGRPDKQWQDINKVALESFHEGFNALKPGITAGELDRVFLAPIKKAGYTYINPSFHGLGLSLEEPMGSFPGQPGYKPDADFVMEPNMVLEFEPHVVALDIKRGLHIGCPVVVTKTGCRLLSETWKPELKII